MRDRAETNTVYIDDEKEAKNWLAKRKQAPIQTGPPGSQEEAESWLANRQTTIPSTPPEPKSVGGFISNVGSSGLDLMGNLANVALHPVDTLKSLGKVGVGLGEKALSPIITDPDNPVETENTKLIDAVFNHMEERYGGLDRLKKTAYDDPIGVAADVAALISGSGGALRATGRLSKVASVVSKAGEIVDPIQQVLKLGGKVASGTGKLAASGLGITSGTNPALIRAAFNNHSAEFVKAMRGEIKMPDILQSAKNAFSQVVKKREINYKQALEGLSGEVDKVPAQRALADSLGEHNIGINIHFPADEAEEILTGVKINVIRLRDPEDIFNLIANKKLPNGAELPPKARINANFSSSSIRHEGSSMARVNDALSDMFKWKDMSAAGADRLRQGLFNRIPTRGVEGAVPVEGASSKILKNVHDVLEDSIMSDVPGYAEAIRSYRKSSEFLDELRNELVGRGSGAAIKKLQNAMKEDADYQQFLIDALDTQTGSKLRDQLGGYIMSQRPKYSRAFFPMLYGIVRGFNPLTLAELAMTSPRAIGETANVVGKVSRAASKVGSKITAPVYRPLIYSSEETKDK